MWRTNPGRSRRVHRKVLSSSASGRPSLKSARSRYTRPCADRVRHPAGIPPAAGSPATSADPWKRSARKFVQRFDHRVGIGRWLHSDATAMLVGRAIRPLPPARPKNGRGREQASECSRSEWLIIFGAACPGCPASASGDRPDTDSDAGGIPSQADLTALPSARRLPVRHWAACE